MVLSIRHSGISTFLGVLVVVALVGACTSTQATPSVGPSATVAAPSATPMGSPPPVPTIPDVTFKWFSGQGACVNYGPLAYDLGYLDELGLKPDANSWKGSFGGDQPGLLVSKSADLASSYLPMLIPTIHGAPGALTTFMLTDLFVGFEIIGNPNGNYKSVEDFVSEGMSRADAERAAVEQIKGKVFVHPAAPSLAGFFNWVFDKATHGVALDEVQDKALADDTAALAEALAGRADFHFGSAPQMAALMGKGWKPIIGAVDGLKSTTPGPDSPVMLMIGQCTLTTQTDYATANHDTILRIAGVVYRIMDLYANDPTGAATVEVKIINEFNGTNLSVDDMLAMYQTQVQHPTFEQAAEWYNNKENSTYWEYPVAAQIKLQEQNGVFPAGKYKPSDAVTADKVYAELVSLKQQAEANLANVTPRVDALAASGKDITTLKELVSKAQTFLSHRAYLDAMTFAAAAKEWADYLGS
jgi:hypothetical protein